MLFNELGLSEEILKAVDEIGYETATEIQSMTIPLLLEGRDVIGRSHTGTGKTAAFGIPAIQRIKKDLQNKVQVLILCPTRELAMQACEEIIKFSKYMPWVKPCAVYGGADIEKQIFQLKRGANIVVGTPGRVMDHLDRHTLRLDNLTTVILDEADEMLNMGFREDIETILEKAPEERQTVLFSATMPPPILAITKEFQNDPVLVKVEQKSRTVESVKQYYFEVPMGRKLDALQMLLLAYEPRLSIIFCNTKRMVDELTESLVSKGYKASGLHGDMKQASRTQVLNAFKSGRLNILIATDVAARGIDVDNVDAVFNYDIPQDNEYYIHRIGRTGRAGKTGAAYSIISGRKQVLELLSIAKFTKAVIECKLLPTREDLIAAKTEKVLEKIITTVESAKYDGCSSQLDALIAQGFTAEQVACALLGMRISKETRTVPEFIKISPQFAERKDRNAGQGSKARGSGVKIEISVGRQNKIAPNFVLGALVDATGLSGKSFGKIDIYDKFTTVEVHEDDKEHILETMTGTKINGHKIKIKTFEGKAAAPASHDTERQKDYRHFDKSRPDNRAKSANRRKNYQ